MLVKIRLMTALMCALLQGKICKSLGAREDASLPL